MRFKKFGIPPGGIKGARGRLFTAGGILDGAKVERIRMTPQGSTICRLLEPRGTAWKEGDIVTVGPGTFRREEVQP